MIKKKAAALAIPMAVFTALALGTPSQALADNPTASKYDPGMYIVQLTDKPLASYDGSISGLKPTKPVDGEKLDPQSKASTAYLKHLSKQREVAAKKAGIKPEVTYSTAFNGFAAKLDPAQAAKLAKFSGVAKIYKSEFLKLDTYTTPEFLGLAGSEGVWQKQFKGQGKAGEGVIVGMIDSGYAPENPSFAPMPEPRPDAEIIKKKWKAGKAAGNVDSRDNSPVCDYGTDPADKPGVKPFTCNNKVIGARWYRTGVSATPEEFDSPRDHGGHGTHTGSTAAGNANVEAYSIASDGKTRIPYGKISGIAPAARLSIYKVCWSTDLAGGNSCSNIDSVKAIDQAVLDGVDVINYSISGSRTSVVDPVEIAFLNAAQAGVFVAASAGNSGDTVGVSSVAHNSPWVTTVAASSHDRAFTKSVTLGNGKSYTGAGVGNALPSAPMIDAVEAGKADADKSKVELCFLDTLDAEKVKGKIVLCKRGTNPRTDKSKAVMQAGGVGMVMYNPTVDALAADVHSVPSIHVDNNAGAAIKAYIAANKAEAKASLAAGTRTSAKAPVMAGFSSYGPSLAGNGNLLKPDITAPGVDIVAAIAPAGNDGQDFASLQGTSMSSPHIAGIAALIKSAHQQWGPMTIKSAMMTTASQKDNKGEPIQAAGKTATPMNFGSGHVEPMKAFDPGLVYESNIDNWLSYICSVGQGMSNPDFPVDCSDFPKMNPSDLNTASIAIGGLTGSQTVKRTVRNVTDKTAVYTAKVEAPAGANITVSPSRLVIAPGKTANFDVKITWNGAPFDKYLFGALTWWDGKGHEVRSPIAVQPMGLVAPSDVAAGSGTEGKVELDVTSGFRGTLKTSTMGLVPATVHEVPASAGVTAFDHAKPVASEHVKAIDVNIPEGTKFARFATLAEDYAEGTDIDLYVYKRDAEGLTPVGSSTNYSAEEAVTVTGAGDYVIFVDLYAAPEGSPDVLIKHHTWTVGEEVGNLTGPGPQTVEAGARYKIPLEWKGLSQGQRYLGAVQFRDPKDQIVGMTLIKVNS